MDQTAWLTLLQSCWYTLCETTGLATNKLLTVRVPCRRQTRLAVAASYLSAAQMFQATRQRSARTVADMQTEMGGGRGFPHDRLS